MDGCLVDSMTGTSLRPGAREALARLVACGHVLVLWSAGGAKYARQRAVEHQIDHLFSEFHGKEQRDDSGCYSVSHLPEDVSRLVFVDDHPEDLPPSCAGMALSSYIVANPADSEMSRVTCGHSQPALEYRIL